MNTGDRRCSRARAAHHRRLAARRRRAEPTRSRARPSSPARPCSGCATGSASSRARPRSRRWPQRAGLRWRDRRAGVRRARRAALASPRARRHHRLTRGTTRAHIARATLEGIALQNVDILRAMERDSGEGAARAQGRRRRRRQRPADAVPGARAGEKSSRPEMEETTARGAAFLGGWGPGSGGRGGQPRRRGGGRGGSPTMDRACGRGPPGAVDRVSGQGMSGARDRQRGMPRSRDPASAPGRARSCRRWTRPPGRG